MTKEKHMLDLEIQVSATRMLAAVLDKDPRFTELAQIFKGAVVSLSLLKTSIVDMPEDLMVNAYKSMGAYVKLKDMLEPLISDSKLEDRARSKRADGYFDFDNFDPNWIEKLLGDKE